MRVEEVIAEFELIKDAEVRRKAISVWEEALAERRLGAEVLEKTAFCADVSAEKVSLAAHIRGVARTAAHLAETYRDLYGLEIDGDALVAAALIHDVGKMDEAEDARLEHSLSSALRAHRAGLPTTTVHAIAFHSESCADKRACVEAELLHFADFAHYRPLLAAKS